MVVLVVDCDALIVVCFTRYASVSPVLFLVVVYHQRLEMLLREES